MAGVTTYDCVLRQLITPEQQQAFFANKNSLHDPYHFSGVADVHEVYDAVDPLKNPKLSQEGKVVFLTGANRGSRVKGQDQESLFLRIFFWRWSSQFLTNENTVLPHKYIADLQSFDAKGIAIAFAKAKAKGLILAARDLSKLEQVEKEINDAYPDTKVLAIKTDVTSESDVKAAFAKAIETFGAVDVAIHNAGINHDHAPITKTELSGWWEHYEIHVKGLWLVAREFLLALGDKVGTLINISSTAAISAFPTQVGYSPSKLAGNRMIEILQVDYPNARVFNLHPGVVDTELTTLHHVAQMGFNMDSPELSGGAALFLTTPDAEFLRGRWVSANWQVDDLVKQREVVVKEHLFVTGLSGKLGAE
ncbi:hypothetical protein LTR84_002676 [Exophiala bonariae]|uniref:Uncharacterized protein n=1 Tax=Exophiala bonariae TaxID=1690606 RepID=A0AAV9ND27_9EURO|nr:hypothetical protein LTR84_002676 [Exophiala bonariae]